MYTTAIGGIRRKSCLNRSGAIFRQTAHRPKKPVCALEKPELRGDLARPGRAHVISVLVILLAAGFLRFAALDSYPLPIHQDELSDIYDGYSLATTGADRWGESWPIIIRGMGPGDYHPGMYAYCAAVSTKLLGFSVWAGRLPAAIAGILTVFLVYLTARRLLSPPASLIALLLVTFSPIHVLYSRQAHQGVCMMPFVVILSVYLMIRLLESLRVSGTLRGSGGWAVACGLTIGLSTNAYAAMRLVAPLLAIAIALAVFVVEGLGEKRWKRTAAILATLVLATTVGASLQLYAAITQPEQFFARSSATAFSLSNGLSWWAGTLSNNLLRELDPRYLFLSFGEYRTLSIARLSIVEMPFLYVGLIASIVLAVYRRSMTLALLPASVAICLLPSMVTRGEPSPMRSSGVWALYPMLSAIGISMLGSLGMTAFAALRSSRARRLAMVGICVAVVGCGVFNTRRYLSTETLHGPAAQHQLVMVGEALAKVNLDNYQRVYIDAEGMFGYLYAAAFSGMTPTQFQGAERTGAAFGLGWEEYEILGRFHFQSADRAYADRRNAKAGGRWLLVTCDGKSVQTQELTADHLAHNGS